MSARAFLVFLAVCAVVALLGFGLLSKGEATIAVGEPVPDRELPVLGGAGQRSIADYRGNWVLVNLWASWCVPCRQEAPELDEFARRYRERGVAVLGINVQDNSDDALAFTVLGLALHLSGMRTEILRRRVRTLTILEAERLDAQAA
jgi:cytochrome c biogenesis protein CcmG/thiol:disulfide interchange protein DsbE